MKKQLMLLLGILSLLIPAGFVVSGAASAESDGKVYVCKYVSTPGESELLQGGGNPLEVSVHSIPTFDETDPAKDEAIDLVGDQFTDAQGGSIVIGVVGGPVLTIEDCPGFQEPEPDLASAAVTVTPPTCVSGAVLVYGAISNAVFSGTADGTVGPGSYEVVATAEDGAEFASGETTMTFSGTLAGPLTGAQCDENPPQTCPDDSEINAGEVIPEGQTAEEFCFIDVQGEQTCPTDSEINAGEVIPEGQTAKEFCNKDNPPRNPPNPPNPQGEQETPEVAGEQARAPVAPAVEVPTTVDSGL